VGCVEYSRDGRRVAYVTYPGGDLWVRSADGSGPVQLTRAPMIAYLVRWSPDGSVLAFMGKSAPDQPWRIYLVESTGGTPRLATPKDSRPQGDLTWSPDGQKIVFSPPNDMYDSGAEAYLRVIDLKTGEVTKFPGSDGLFSPRWSPDGSVLFALPAKGGADGRRSLMLYRVSRAKWEESGNAFAPTWPAWSADGKSLWYYSYGKAVMRFHVRENRHEQVVPFKLDGMTGLWRSWFSVTSKDEPMILRRHDIPQIYALEWKER
jgi:Tol biopolymer transport system component